MVSDFNPRPFLSTISRGRVQKWGEDFSTAASSSSLEQRRFSFLNQLRASSDDAVEDLFLGRRHTTDSVDGQPRCILRELLTLPAKSPFPEQVIYFHHLHHSIRPSFHILISHLHVALYLVLF